MDSNKNRQQFDFAIPGQLPEKRGTTVSESAQRDEIDTLPDFSRMTKKELKDFDNTEGSYKRLLGERPITLLWLLNHYSKPNARAYKAQKEAKKRKKADNEAGSSIRMPTSIPTNTTVVQDTELDNDMFGQTVVLNKSSATIFSIPKDSLVLNCVNYGQTVEIKKLPFRIGRDAQINDLCLEDNETISHKHAEIRSNQDNYVIVDLNSTNHVYVDGYQIQPNVGWPLKNGSEIILSNETFYFYIQ